MGSHNWYIRAVVNFNGSYYRKSITFRPILPIELRQLSLANMQSSVWKRKFDPQSTPDKLIACEQPGEWKHLMEHVTEMYILTKLAFLDTTLKCMFVIVADFKFHKRADYVYVLYASSIYKHQQHLKFCLKTDIAI